MCSRPGVVEGEGPKFWHCRNCSWLEILGAAGGLFVENGGEGGSP